MIASLNVFAFLDMLNLEWDAKLVYKIKTQADGTVQRYKPRLVTRGFTQEYVIDYEETFALVAHLTSVRSLIVVAAVRGWVFFKWM